MQAETRIGMRLDRLPLSRYHWSLLALVAAGMYFDSFDIYIAGSVLAAMIKTGESTLQLNATFVSVTFVGMMAGACLSGIMGDRYGRRFCYQFNLLIYGIASIAAAFSPSIYWLIFFRLVMGVGMGAEIVVGYGTLSEFIPPAWRGRFGTIVNLIINSSLFLSTLLGWVIVPRHGWRWMFAIAGVGSLVAWFLRKRMPESPRWLASKGREPEAIGVVESIEAACGVKPLATAAPPAEAQRNDAVAVAPSHLRDLFAPGMRARTASAITVLCVQFIAQFAFISWIPTFLVKEGHTISNSLGITAVMFAGGPVGSVIAFLLTERMGRKWGIVAFSLICAGLGVSYAFAHTAITIASLGFAITACLYVLSSFTIASYVPELFPTALRLRGTGLANTIGRAVSIGLPYVVAAAYAGTGIAGVLTLIVGTLLAQAVIVGIFGPETKNRSLESISTQADTALQTPVSRATARADAR